MFIQKNIKKVKGKIYKSFLLVHNERINGKVKHNVLANLSSLPEELINKFEKIIKNKNNLSDINEKNFYQEQGKKYGALKVISEISKKINLTEVLGKTKYSKLIQIMLSGVILSPKKSKNYIANFWKKDQAIEDVFKYKKYYNEDDFYDSLKWLSKNQEKIEHKLWEKNNKKLNKKLFLYDVTSSYVEGDKIELTTYGYNRDGKKGKKQIVIGLLTDNEGLPVSVEVFEGNTRDFKTVSNQIKKIKNLFGVEKVIFVGDRGMIKNAQIDEINSENWNYITCITKPQIEKLLKEKTFKMSLFDENLCEVENEKIRYILRKNPIREIEIKNNLNSRIKCIEKKIIEKNKYLKEHKKAKIETAENKIKEFINKLKLKKIINYSIKKRKISYKINENEKQEYLKLAGCYVLKTNVLDTDIDKEIINKKYKNLSKVENDFKTLKTGFLQIRPLFLRREAQIRGHVFLCVLALRIVREAENKLKDLNFPLEYIWSRLESISYIVNIYKDQRFKVLPKVVDKDLLEILKKLEIKLPKTL